jgi:hypothetical protein
MAKRKKLQVAWFIVAIIMIIGMLLFTLFPLFTGLGL